MKSQVLEKLFLWHTDFLTTKAHKGFHKGTQRIPILQSSRLPVLPSYRLTVLPSYSHTAPLTTNQ